MRNEMSVNALKTNDSAKWLIYALNDFKGLLRSSRNDFFRLAKRHEMSGLPLSRYCVQRAT